MASLRGSVGSFLRVLPAQQVFLSRTRAPGFQASAWPNCTQTILRQKQTVHESSLVAGL